MRKLLKILVLAITILAIFVGCTNASNIDSQYENNGVNNEIENKETKSSFSLSKTKINQQIKADIVLDREISGTQRLLYNYSFTNGNKYIDTIYDFNVDPDTLITDETLTYETYENNYVKKYSYLYLNGKSDSDIQVQRRIYNDLDDEIWYDYQCFYIRSSEYNDKLQAYHSYDIGTSGTVFEDEYFCYSYDDNGLLTDTTDDTGYKNYFYYDDQDILVSRTFDVTESDYYQKNYSYEKDSDKGNIITVYVYNSETGNTLNRYEYSYNSNNCITEEVVYTYVNNEEKRVKRHLSYTYDDSGNILSTLEEVYNSDTEEYDTTSMYYYYNDNNNIDKIITDNGKSVKYTVFVYTDNPAEYINEN